MQNTTNELTDNKKETLVEPDLITARLDAIENGLKAELEESRAETASLREAIKNVSKSNANSFEDDVVDTARRSAHVTSLPVIDGVPIVWARSSPVTGMEGIELIMIAKDANGKEFTIPFGCNVGKVDFSDKKLKDVHQTSYENLKTQKFELQDIDENDLTGASKIEKGKVVDEGSVVPEMDRSSGTPMPTGRKIKTTVKADARHYTILFDGKKITLTDKELGNIRIN
jgi:hypothetical protein